MHSINMSMNIISIILMHVLNVTPCIKIITRLVLYYSQLSCAQHWGVLKGT